MPDSYAHICNAHKALEIAKYKPRCYDGFILGCNAPDVFFYYHKGYLFRSGSMSGMSKLIHNHKPGLFIQNLFRHAQTNAQKDFCLGFLCHYAMDSTLHPYINYITTAYGSPFNRDMGHQFFESALDTYLFREETGYVGADPALYMPETNKMHFDQIITLLKQTCDSTYPEQSHERSQYVQAFTDFRRAKRAMYAPGVISRGFAHFQEVLFRFKKDYIISRLQPAIMEIGNETMWRNNRLGFFCPYTVQDVLERANHLAADNIAVGLKYFDGVYSAADLLEDIGNKNYMTGMQTDE